MRFGSWGFGNEVPRALRLPIRMRGLMADFRRALSDFKPEDNIGSPYSVRRYVVDSHLGWPEGLAIAGASWQSAA